MRLAVASGNAPLSEHRAAAVVADLTILIPLELAFRTKSLRHICESESEAERVLGTRVASALRRRLADLRAASCVADLLAGQPSEIEGSTLRQFGVHLSQGHRLVFCANHNVTPELKSGGTDWSLVTRVKILRIEDSHG